MNPLAKTASRSPQLRSRLSTSFLRTATLFATLSFAMACGSTQTKSTPATTATSPKAAPQKTVRHVDPTKSKSRCKVKEAGLFGGTRLQLRVCRVPLEGKPGMRRSVRFFSAEGRRLGQASTRARPWPTARRLPALGTVLDGPDPLWVLPRGFAAIHLPTRRVEKLFEVDGDRRIVAAVQRAQRIGVVTFGRSGCVPAKKGCLSWLVVDFAKGALLLRQQLPAARAVGLGFGRHQGQPAAWLHVTDGAAENPKAHAWVAHLAARPASAPPTTTAPAKLTSLPRLPAKDRRRWWVHP